MDRNVYDLSVHDEEVHGDDDPVEHLLNDLGRQDSELNTDPSPLLEPLLGRTDGVGELSR